MAKQKSGFLKGCAIGCGACLLLLVGIVALSAYYLKTSISDFETADHSFEVLEERFGPPGDYIPDPTGDIGADRVELFLEVREKTADSRSAIEETLAVFGPEEGTFRKILSSVRLPGQCSEFIQQHNLALLQAGMSPAEYDYIYVQAFYNLLHKSPSDGPSFKLVNEYGFVLDEVIVENDRVVRERRERWARLDINSRMLRLLQNQVAGIPEDEQSGWRRLLTGEIAALEADSLRIPWQDGLPEQLAASLEPQRQRLEESYGGMCNALEIGLARR